MLCWQHYVWFFLPPKIVLDVEEVENSPPLNTSKLIKKWMCISGTQFSCRLVELPAAVADVEAQLLNVSILEAKWIVSDTRNSSTDNILYLVNQSFPVIGFAGGKDFANAFRFDGAFTDTVVKRGIGT